MATFLLLIIVAILIFAMATANLGEVSETALGVANAADASALSLGSQLASKSNQLCKSLTAANESQKGFEEHEKTGTCNAGDWGLKACGPARWRKWVAPIAGAVLAAFGVPVSHWWVYALTAGGAQATVEGLAERSWGAALNGFLIGFGTGAAIAGGAQLLGSTLAGPGGVTVKYAATGQIVTFGEGAPLGAALAAGGEVTGATVGLGLSALAAGGLATGLAGGAAAYQGARDVHTQQIKAQATLQTLSKLPEYERIREGTLLQALTQVVDDPNRTQGPGNPEGACYFPARTEVIGDPFDADGDGDREESIPCFQHWESVRLNMLSSKIRSREALITSFMEGPANFVEGQPIGQSLRQRLEFAKGALAYLERNEVECACQGSGGPVRSEGPTVSLFRILLDKGYPNPGIFEPGPDATGVLKVSGDPCVPTCAPPPEGWDSVDRVKATYEDFIHAAAELVYHPSIHIPQGYATKEAWYRQLAQVDTFERWLPELYDPDFTSDIYDRLDFIGNEINGWFLWTRDTLVPSLPECKLSSGDHPTMAYTQQQSPPLCANFDPVFDRDTGAFIDDADPLYPCTYTNNASSPPTAQGIYLANPDFNPSFAGNFPAPVCKIDLAHREGLLTKMAVVKTFVQNLDNWILQDHAEHFKNAACADADDKVVTKTKDMTLVSIDQVGAPKWGNGATLPSDLVYTFTYAYECNTCSGASCPGPLYTHQKQDTKRHTVPEAADFEVPMQDGKQPFLAVVDTFKSWLGSLQLDAQRRRFSTIDPDLDNEMSDAIGWLFITNAEPYFFNAEEGRWAGTSAIDFFRRNIEGFLALLQDLPLGTPPPSGVGWLWIVKARVFQRGIALPEDGRLPNPKQIVNDPIRGSHPVDGRYTWRDSQGIHSVNVEIGPFIKPATKHTNPAWWGGKHCDRLINYCENTPGCPYQGPDRAWVRITRQDPTNPMRFWRWNPFAGTMRRTGRASYDRLAVGLCGTGGVQCP